VDGAYSIEVTPNHETAWMCRYNLGDYSTGPLYRAMKIPGLYNQAFGCLDEQACNYDPEAILDSGCDYAPENYNCNGNCIGDMDCAGTCGGSAVEDECGVCAGGGPPENYNCALQCIAGVDCNGQCGGLLLGIGDGIGNDACGICGGPGPPENYNCALQCIAGVDCNGICGGSDGPEIYCQNGTSVCNAIECIDLVSKIHMLPEKYSIVNIYPNPFNPVTTIHYTLPENTYANLLVYDIRGRQVTSLLNDFQTAGSYAINWDAASYPSGMYFIILENGSKSLIKKMVLLK